MDAPMVAIIWCALFSIAAGVPLSLNTWAALGCAVWTIYLADRWLDGVPELPQLLPERHRFWMGQRPLLAVVAAVAVASAIWFGWRAATWALLAAAAPAGLGALVHLAVVHRLRWRYWPKEAAVGAIFAMGVLAPVAAGLCAMPAPLAAAASVFALLCWLNCVVIEYGEWRAGIAMGEPGPWVAACGRHTARIAAGIALLTVVFGLAAGRTWHPVLAAEAGASVLLAMVGARRWLDPTALATAADLALLLPAVGVSLLEVGLGLGRMPS
ncbi:MAG: hypothetical protein R2762_03985 [Bryobacteraceae bacterium]